MAVTTGGDSNGNGNDATGFKPYIPRSAANVPELTIQAVLAGAVLGVVFGASSVYLVLKVGMTVSASIPVAVLSITLFRALSRVLGVRKSTILENNVVQTAGSAGESIAFGVGVTMPALFMLGFEMDIFRVTSVAVLGGLLGILMMIPLRRAFIVKQHGQLKYPEGTACAEVLEAGEKGGASAITVFFGFFLAFAHKFCTKSLHLFKEEAAIPLYSKGQGLIKGVLGAELSPELLGVGYIIGPRIASIMFGGGVLAYLVFVPLIALIGENVERHIYPAVSTITEQGVDVGLIKNMSVGQIRNNYILYIGAGAVATGGIISMFQAMPLIISSFLSSLRDIRQQGPNGNNQRNERDRTDRDLPVSVVVFGSLALILAMAATPQLGLGFNTFGILGALLVLVFGFLFVTVSSRLTGEIGSSSNPISGMTVATLLLTCLVFLLLGRTDKAATLTALSIAGVVCIAASNGGTTSQDLKTGHLVGGTPWKQQVAILIGALVSALVIGWVLMGINEAGTVYSTKNLPTYKVDVAKLDPSHKQRPGGEYAGRDANAYFVWNVAKQEVEGVPAGKYLVDETGAIRYFVDPAVGGKLSERDDGQSVKSSKFDAPKTQLMAFIIDGILQQKLPWSLVLIGVLTAITLELAGIPSLPFAVGIYLPIETSTPIFIGGAVRWIVEKITGRSSAETDSSPSVLLSSGYIAGGTIAGVVCAFLVFAGDEFNAGLASVGANMGTAWSESELPTALAFAGLVLVLAAVAMGWLFKEKLDDGHG